MLAGYYFYFSAAEVAMTVATACRGESSPTVACELMALARDADGALNPSSTFGFLEQSQYTSRTRASFAHFWRKSYSSFDQRKACWVHALRRRAGIAALSMIGLHR